MVKKNRKIYVTTILSRDMFESAPEFEIAKQLQKMLKTKEIGEGFYTYNCKVQIDNDTAKYRWIDFSYVDKFGNKVWLEYNGYQHYGLCDLNKFNQTILDAQQHRDKIVRRHAYKNNILMLVIGTKSPDQDITFNLNCHNIEYSKILTSMSYVGKAKYLFNHKVIYK